MSSDDFDCGVCLWYVCVIKLIGVVIGLVFMTITSPGWLLYGFFTTEWLIKDSSNNNGLYSTTTVDLTQREYYGLYMKCYQGNCEDYILDETTFGLEVTAVVFQFLALLALPWLKYCLPDNKYLMYWNFCLIPFMLIAAVMSLSACIYFSVKHHEYSTEKDIVTVGSSVGCAGVGGGFQIVLAFVIVYIFSKNDQYSRNPPAAQTQSPPSRAPSSWKKPSTGNAKDVQVKAEITFIKIFVYNSFQETNAIAPTTEGAESGQINYTEVSETTVEVSAVQTGVSRNV